MKPLILSAALSVGTLVALAPDDAQAAPRPVRRAVPELSVAGAGTALALIAGGILVAAGRKRRRSE